LNYVSQSNEIAALVSDEELAFLSQAFLTVDAEQKIICARVPDPIYDALAVAGNGSCLQLLNNGLKDRLLDALKTAVSRGNLHAAQSLFYTSPQHLRKFPLPAYNIRWNKRLVGEERLEEIMPGVLDWCCRHMQPCISNPSMEVAPYNHKLPLLTKTLLLQAIRGVSGKKGRLVLVPYNAMEVERHCAKSDASSVSVP